MKGRNYLDYLQVIMNMAPTVAELHYITVFTSQTCKIQIIFLRMRHKSTTHIIKENKKPKYKYNRNKKVNRAIVTSAGEPLHWTSTKQKKMKVCLSGN